MPYTCNEKKCSIRYLLYISLLFISLNGIAQARWDGEAGDGQWSTPANWVANMIPLPTDDVLLDNSIVTGSFIVALPATAAVTVKSITISPATGNSIQLSLPSSNTTTPAFTATGPGYGIIINTGGLFVNSSGATSAASVVVNDSIKINNGGQYTHNTRSAHAGLVTVLSRLAGTETGIFKFDVPGGGYTFAATNRSYGTLIFSSDASGGIQAYATSAANPFTVNGNLVIKTGVTINLDITAATFIKGSYIQEGGVFNLASQANNNSVYVKKDLMQTAGIITETSNGHPGIELNGNTNQNIRMSGGISGDINFTVNNSAGISLLTDLSLPYNLDLINGVVNNHSFVVTLLSGCSIQADPLSNSSFINGPLRKEGLNASSYFLFPVGKDITQRWISLRDASGNYTVEFFKSNPANLNGTMASGLHHISSIEYWGIHADASPAPSAKIELSFDNVNSGGVTDMSTLRVAQLQTGVWNDKGNTATTGSAGSAGSVVSNLLNMFNTTGDYFTLSSNNAFQNPLPLRLKYFGATIRQNNVLLSWATRQDIQLLAFDLQSSSDGIYFTSLGSPGVMPGQQEYQYADKRRLSGIQYYRLKLIEKDASNSYSETINVVINGGSEEMRLWPSIVSANAVLFIDAASAHTTQITVHDIDGRVRLTRKVFLYAGSNTIPVQLQWLPAGIYTISVKAEGNGLYTRFIKSN